MSEFRFDKEEYINRINLVMEQNGIFANELDSDTDMELDSLSIVSILVCLENEFDFAFPDDELLNVPQVYNDFVQFVLDNIEKYFANNEPNATLPCKGGEYDA